MISPDDQFEEIAIIGLACRFPGASNVDQFWHNLRNGVESVTFFTDQELLSAGVNRHILSQPNCVKARAIIDDIDMFDAPLFGFTSKEAEITDPQHRLFLQCSWEALEDAGYDPTVYPHKMGLYAGAGFSGYLAVVLSNPEVLKTIGSYRVLIANDKDFLSTMVSYKLGLRGPSVVVQTACSTSLVAVHLACQSLLNGECNMALAGGVSIRLPQRSPYLYQEGGILSPDGHCRAFDADSQGTVGGEGVGVVVLKRLSEALRDRDNIHAVIKASSINNDGSSKVGFTAPSITGQAEVIAETLDLANINPETITYIEAHGTGTALGDPIEIAALTRAFRVRTTKKTFCAIGSVKTNIGHLDSAAGVAGLIKTVLMLRHKLIPPTLHFRRPNHRIGFEDSPFYVQSSLSEWGEDSPRRAGVSSFGIGGTNAHVIVEEAPASAASDESRPWQLMVLSARTDATLEKTTENITRYINDSSCADIADVAYTLQVGRKVLEHRRMFVCRDRFDAVDVLATRDPSRLLTAFGKPGFRPVMFMFPGQGTQYANMTAGLYDWEPYFRDLVDRCAQILKPSLGLDFRDFLYPTAETTEEAGHKLGQTQFTQPALFAIEYCLARLWIHWGVQPEAMIGHSLGEYVAACLAGTIALEDALTLVVLRGRLMASCSEGKMLAVNLPEADLIDLLRDDLSLAAVNSPSQCVVSGSSKSVIEFRERLREKSIRSTMLQTSYALHSQMMDPILGRFRQHLEGIKLKPPSIKYLSNVTGTWITDAEVCAPDYWLKHLRQTVRFSDGVSHLLREPDAIMLEVGPGQVLSNLAAQQVEASSRQVILSSLPFNKKEDEQYHLLKALGSLWLSGLPVQWSHFHQGTKRKHVSLPTYPFEQKRYWVQASTKGSSVSIEDYSRRDVEFQSSVETKELEAIMPEQLTTSSSGGSARRSAIIDMLHSVVHELTGFTTSEKHLHINFFDLGVDSLLIIQFTQAIQNRCGLKIPYRQLFDDLATIQAVAAHLDEKLPSHMFAPDPVVEKPKAAAAAAAQSTTAVANAIAVPKQYAAQAKEPDFEAETAEQETILFQPTQSSSEPASPVRVDSAVSLAAPFSRGVQNNYVDGALPTDLYSYQLRIISQQLEIMQRMSPTGFSGTPTELQQQTRMDSSADLAIPAVVSAAKLPQSTSEATNGNIGFNVKINAAGMNPSPAASDVTPKFETPSFLPHKPLDVSTKRGLPQIQEEYLEEFSRRYIERTRESKRIAANSRGSLADSRLSVGFSHLFKELVYPIYGNRGEGSKVWDVDGNEYLDISMGYGVNLFGNSPSFIAQAIQQQLNQGLALAPQLELTGQVAALICELTGVERVNFCNSGTEAVMGAVRIARTVTQRNRIAMFAGSYHGWSDGTLARPINFAGQIRTVPVAPGVNPKSVEDVLVLDYGDPKSLEVLQAHANELAAVLVEPVQSRRPDLQPREFLRQLRQLTEHSGTALIFDEMITGFRIHPGGAQHWFDIRADIATYGKIVGGGLPIGVVAGKSVFMDAFDGGRWNFGDASYPQADKTFFAAAFFKHPLSMAAASAVLNHIKEAGPGLQEALNRQTTYLATTLNEYFQRNSVPINVVHFGSLFRFVFGQGMKHTELFFYHLIQKGLFTWEGGNYYLSTAHSHDDVQKIIQTVIDTVQNMQGGGFLPRPTNGPGGGQVRSASGAKTPGNGNSSQYASSASGAELRQSDNGSTAIPKTPDKTPETRCSSAELRSWPSVSVQPAPAPSNVPLEKKKPVEFSLYYFGNYEPEFRADKYDLIFRGARYADDHGFSAIWIPERHFDSFGGFSPNASVLAAAIARETQRLNIRAGSVVMPLHNPVRVAEEWAMVDNLSQGRVGISFASGWHPNDFVFAPDSYEDRRRIMDEGIDVVRRLWRGESLSFKSGNGENTSVRLVPMPKQRELPFWLTIVSPQSSVKAGQMGAGFLTNFMGQSFDEVAEKIAAYRKSVLEHHGPGTGHVTVQVHTLMSDDLEKARQKIRKPLYEYFKASFGLKNATVPNNNRRVDLDNLSQEDMEYVFGGAYKHYVHNVGLIGTPDYCTAVVDRLIKAGVDEICCLVDFGVDIDLALESLHYTNELKRRYEQAPAENSSPSDAKGQEPIYVLETELTNQPRPDTTLQVRRLPMTEGQKQLWALAQISEDANSGYNESVMLDLRGSLDVEAMRKALQDIVDRHEALRITFDSNGEHQLIHPSMKVQVPFLDLSHLNGKEREQEFNTWSMAEMGRAFDLAQCPVFRFRLARLEQDHHVLIFTYHHSIVDGQSVGVFVGDLKALYTAHCLGESGQLPAARQFSDYVDQQSQQQTSVNANDNETYWMKVFEGDLQPLDLPTDRPRPLVKTFKRRRYAVTLGNPIAQDIYRFCRTKRCTGFLMMLAAFKVLLHKLTDQQDFIVAITTTDKAGVNDKDLIGFRLNPLALRSRITSDPTFSEFLAYVKGQMWDAFEHQDFSLSKLYRSLKLQWQPGRLSPVSVKFHLDRGSSEFEFHQLKARLIDNPSPAPMFDLTLDVTERPDELLFRWNYNPELFDESTIQSWMQYFEVLLKAIVEDPEVRLSALPRLTSASSVITQESEPTASISVEPEILSLTRYQQRIWTWQKFNPEAPIYNQTGFWIVPEMVDRNHLEQAIIKLAENNDALRTVIREKDGIPYQCVLPKVDCKLEYQDFSSMDDPQAAFRQWAQQRCRSPFDLEKRPFDVALIKLADQECGLYIGLSHILADARSVTLTQRLVSDYYCLSREGRLESAPARPSFRDYVRSELEYLESPRARESEEYWNQKLAEAVQPIAFYGRPVVKRSSRVDRTTFELGPDLSRQLQEAARDKEIFTLSADLSLFCVLTAVLCAYLYRISGSSQISLGVPVHNRKSNEETLGLFMHVLPLRIVLEKGETFLSLIRKVRSEFITMLRHSQYPVGNALQKNAYDVVFNYINTPFKYEFANTRSIQEWVHSGYGHESLTLQVRVTPEAELIVDLDTHCDVFEPLQRDQSIKHLGRVIDSFLDDPGQLLHYVDFLTPEERFQILHGFNQTERDFPHQETFASLFESQVQRAPDSIAIRIDGQSVTYARLNAAANGLASYLRSAGIVQESVVALLARRGINFVTAILAIFKAGAAYLPLDLLAPRQRLAQILSQSESPLVLVANDCIEDLFDTLDLMTVDCAPTVAQLDKLLSDSYQENDFSIESSARNLSYVIYTSGSTGTPKGAMVEQQGMMNHLFVKIADLQLDHNSIVAQTAPQSFDISVWQFLAALLVGGQVHIVDDNACRDPLELRRLIERESITIFETVPTLLRAMLEMEIMPSDSRFDLSSLKWLLVTGEALQPDLARQWLTLHSDIPLLNAYGPTECSDDVTHYAISDPPDTSVSVMPIGPAVGNIRIYILDENLEPTPSGMPGEVGVAGIGVGRGYLKDPSRTAQVFVPDPHGDKPGARLYRTGDLGRYLHEGIIEFLGRIDHQVKIRGYRIELGEIESHLLQHPDVHEAVAVVREVQPGDKRLVGYLVPHQSKTITTNELRNFLEDRLPRYMVPSAFVVMGALPLTANGKVDRKSLPLPGAERPEVDDMFVAPQMPIEEMLAGIWQKALHLEQVGVNDNFFELGGDSILAVQVAVRANQMGLRVAPMDIFERQTIVELADWLSRHSLVQAEQGPVSGHVHITPTQKRWLTSCITDPVHQASTLIVELQPETDPDLLEQALEQLVLHHDALRLRFTKDDSGWEQVNAATEEDQLMARIDLTYLGESELDVAIDSVLTGLQASMDLSQGPILQAAFLRFNDNKPPRLLIAIHPLAADDPSRHILLSDLQMAYQQLRQGESIRLPLKSTSFKEWSERLVDYAASEEPQQERDYWLSELGQEFPGLLFDRDEVESVAAPETVSVSLGFDEMDPPASGDSEPPPLPWSDISLIALARVIRRWTGGDRVLIDLERNVRTVMSEGVDLSRTIGPVTISHPVALTVNDDDELADALKSIRQKIENVPNHGLGYGILRFLGSDPVSAETVERLMQSDIGFAYLDQIYSLTLESSLFEKSGELGEYLKCRRSHLLHPLEVYGCLSGGRLHFHLLFDAQRFARSTIERLAASFAEELRTLIKRLLSEKIETDSEPEISDFNLDQHDIEKIKTLITKSGR